ncbi:hypothetical protein DV736_g1078, partial [Chaetothyriales sp. CBS 134916]
MATSEDKLRDNEMGLDGTSRDDFAKATHHMSHEEKHTAARAAKFGYGPLAHLGAQAETMLPGQERSAFGGEFQPGLYKPVEGRKFANPAPLGLCAFALTTFLLSLINLGTLSLTSPAIIISLAFGYGGLIQLLAGMWEMAVGNTFGATALSSYGGFWISFGIILTPGGFEIEATTQSADGTSGLLNLLGLYLMAWFIFTTLLLFCTLRSTLAFFFLFLVLDLAFLLLGIAYLQHDSAGPNIPCLRAGGVFGLLAAFAAWYNALAGMVDSSNSFFVIPVVHFPWSARGQVARSKTDHTA